MPDMRPVKAITIAAVLLLLAECGMVPVVRNANPTTAVGRQSASVPSDTAAPSNTNAAAPSVVVPISGLYDRITKKPFGPYVTPQNSPVQPERFSGFHAGADAETTPAEQSVDVPVYSIADGTVTYVSQVNGYGGVVMVRCVVDGETVTALYGHVRPSSVTVKQGDAVSTGERLAVLGTGYSTETDGERKHLHFALLRGASSAVKGYVPMQADLSAWYDPVVWLRDRRAVEPAG